MVEKELFQRIKIAAPNLQESDLDTWIVPSLLEHYDSKLKYLARHAYSVPIGDSGITLAIRAFKEVSKAELRSALETYLFKKEHWKDEGRSLNAYLKVVLDRLANKTHWDNESPARTRKMVCPLCKTKNSKEFLVNEGGMLRCRTCSQDAVLLRDAADRNPEDLSLQRQAKCKAVFALHSKTGYRCHGCERFVPSSAFPNNFLVCPYEDCDEFGDVSSFLKMSHPSSVASRYHVHLESPLTNRGGNRVGAQDMATVGSILEGTNIDSNSYSLIEAKSELEYKIKLVKEVIQAQKAKIQRNNGQGTMVQKILMYDAMLALTEELPEDMVRYLCHRKHSSSDPLQAKIFQKYASLLEDYLPFTIERGGKKIQIVSLTAPELSLFSGISKYDSVVGEGGVIPNETKETYVGGRKYKNHGPCFIGKLINIVDTANQKSVLGEVKGYTFSKIDTSLKPGTSVQVTHFRIPSHYEMEGLVFLQRIRRSLVDSIYYRLYSKKREVNT